MSPLYDFTKQEDNGSLKFFNQSDSREDESTWTHFSISCKSLFWIEAGFSVFLVCTVSEPLIILNMKLKTDPVDGWGFLQSVPS